MFAASCGPITTSKSRPMTGAPNTMPSQAPSTKTSATATTTRRASTPQEFIHSRKSHFAKNAAFTPPEKIEGTAV